MNHQDLVRAMQELQSKLCQFGSSLTGQTAGPPTTVPNLRGAVPAIKLPNIPAKLTAGSCLPICVVCADANFNGAQWWWANGWDYVGDAWNDKISSIVVVSGQWRFWENAHLQGAKWDLGPGWYPDLSTVNIPNDAISSAEVIGL